MIEFLAIGLYLGIGLGLTIASDMGRGPGEDWTSLGQTLGIVLFWPVLLVLLKIDSMRSRRDL